MDGCGYLRYLFTFLPKLMMPVLSTAFISLKAIGVWATSFGAPVCSSSQEHWPVTLGLFNFKGTCTSRWSLLSAATMIVAAPLLLVYLFLQALPGRQRGRRRGELRCSPTKGHARHGRFPYRLTRAGVVMRPDPNDAREAEGVLNPAAAWAPDGRLKLFPRVVARGNFSRIAVADVVIGDGVPIGVQRRGIALAPDRAFERGSDHGGVEDPRITFVSALGLYLMAYVAYGPAGPRAALATSPDLIDWTRLGPVQFRYDDDLGVDLNLFANKDLAFFPDPVTGPDGSACLGFLHRPMFELPGQQVELPAGSTDARAAISSRTCVSRTRSPTRTRCCVRSGTADSPAPRPTGST